MFQGEYMEHIECCSVYKWILIQVVKLFLNIYTDCHWQATISGCLYFVVTKSWPHQDLFEYLQ